MRAIRIRTKKTEIASNLPKIHSQIEIVDVESGIEIKPMACDIQIRRDDFITAEIVISVADIDLIAMVTKWKLEGND